MASVAVIFYILILHKLAASSYIVFTNRRSTTRQQHVTDANSIREYLNILCNIIADGDEEKIRELDARLHRLQLRQVCKQVELSKPLNKLQVTIAHLWKRSTPVRTH
ncbi:hypothetical protein D918_09682 [Trichuris suis]|nr:hypothetical protein D918_09682 [Trichuris suis]